MQIKCSRCWSRCRLFECIWIEKKGLTLLSSESRVGSVSGWASCSPLCAIKAHQTEKGWKNPIECFTQKRNCLTNMNSEKSQQKKSQQLLRCEMKMLIFLFDRLQFIWSVQYWVTSCLRWLNKNPDKTIIATMQRLIHIPSRLIPVASLETMASIKMLANFSRCERFCNRRAAFRAPMSTAPKIATSCAHLCVYCANGRLSFVRNWVLFSLG